MGIENRETLGTPSDDVVRLRMRLVIEEAFEFLAASTSNLTSLDFFHATLIVVLGVIDETPAKPDLVEVADALADLDYVVAGTRLAYGIPRGPVADEVHRSNMAKAPGGMPSRRPVETSPQQQQQTETAAMDMRLQRRQAAQEATRLLKLAQEANFVPERESSSRYVPRSTARTMRQPVKD